MADIRSMVLMSTHAFNLAVAPMIVIARDGQVCLWNDAAEKLFKNKKNVCLSNRTPVCELFEKRSNSVLTDIIVSASGAPLSVEIGADPSAKRSDKRSITVRALTQAGMETMYLLTIGTDVPFLTSFRKLNIQLKETNTRSAAQRRRMKEIQTKNEELEQFSIATAHDLKAPLVQVQMLLDFFIEDYGNVLEKDAKELIDKANLSVHNLTQMIDKLLNQARQDTDNYEEQLTDLDKSVTAVISSMDEILNSIDAKVVVLPNMGTVRGSEIKFQQVLNNIISNSIKYRMADRQLTISIEVDHWENKPSRLRVRDNGIGFEAADAKHLFEPFSRLEDNEAKGHGVGLSTCRRVCEQQGWMLAATGTPGEGSEFQIIFNTQLPADLGETLAMP